MNWMGAVCELLKDVYREQVFALAHLRPVNVCSRAIQSRAAAGRHWCSVSGHICKDKKCSTAVDPPDDLMVLDPGFLGYLKISWSPPASLTNATECPKLYQLEYFDAYRGKWNVSAKIDSTRLNTPPVFTRIITPFEQFQMREGFGFVGLRSRETTNALYV